MAEGVNKDFSYSKLAERIMKLKNKGALIDSLHKIDFESLNNVVYALNKIEPIYNEEVWKHLKETKILKLKNVEIIEALYKIKESKIILVSKENLEIKEDLDYCTNTLNSIKNNSIKVDEDIKNVNIKLTEIETTMSLVSLTVSYTKSSLYFYLLRNPNITKDMISLEFSISIPQLNRYLRFKMLIDKYPSLIHLSLSFTTIVTKISEIESYIQANDELKNICKAPSYCNLI
ncbi:unnamed protein product [Rotaria socialis]|uniref:Uncharacterized protein n=1 Tax=Rotaria socialis TaxID=392032 RepID=A0A818VC61_9BILA|nr:unnamed protein product [Rotaria socialis]